ncbi:unnamed protein product [Heligmosomoides polygyrus]|uniref:Recep_L_domain domain-containing protein n=1 Tax=Heligmosomoides polygyrus TaxID=6339 RepID=A0A183GJF3_HELPZ|nr:unnamed protein product [Heligmosomoides polygyrus]
MFEETYLPASMVDPWAPWCTTIRGRIEITWTSNFTESQLNKLFRNVTTIVGSVAVMNTTFKRISFLKNIVTMNVYLNNGK